MNASCDGTFVIRNCVSNLLMSVKNNEVCLILNLTLFWQVRPHVLVQILAMLSLRFAFNIETILKK